MCWHSNWKLFKLPKKNSIKHNMFSPCLYKLFNNFISRVWWLSKPKNIYFFVLFSFLCQQIRIITTEAIHFILYSRIYVFINMLCVQCLFMNSLFSLSLSLSVNIFFWFESTKNLCHAKQKCLVQGWVKNNNNNKWCNLIKNSIKKEHRLYW